MAALSGTVLASKIVPSDSLDLYATHDDKYARGGFRPVQDITERDAITDARRKEGMLVYVQDENKTYTLKGGITNLDWREFDAISGFNYTNLNQMPEDLGGLQAGTTFNNTKLQDLLDIMLYPDMIPEIVDVKLFQNSDEVKKDVTVGDSINNLIKFEFIIKNKVNLNANSLKVTDLTRNIVLGENLSLEDDFSYNLNDLYDSEDNDGNIVKGPSGEIKYLDDSSHEFLIEAETKLGTNIKYILKITWNYPIYFGESNNVELDPEDVTKLRKSKLGNSESIYDIYQFLSGGYKYIAYPNLHGNLLEFIDLDSKIKCVFNPADVIVVELSNGEHISYNIYRSKHVLNSNMKIEIKKPLKGI